MKMQWLGLAFLGAFAWAIGCGGNVVVDENTGGGNGGSPPGTTSSTTSSTTTTGDPGTLCKQICEQFQQLQCDMDPVDQCTSGCLDLYTQFPACTGQLDAFLQCLIAAQTCNLSAVCVDASNAFSECANGGGCDGVECSGGSDGSCDCKGVCFGQELGTSCAPDPSGSLSCQCFVGGAFLGSCTDNGFSCDFQNGCCAAFFFGE